MLTPGCNITYGFALAALQDQHDLWWRGLSEEQVHVFGLSESGRHVYGRAGKHGASDLIEEKALPDCRW